MGKSLLHLESFKQSVSKCGDALRPFGVDLVDLLENCSNESFTDPVVSFVGIAAIQIALVDLLYAMKINAEGFVGHSAGEIGNMLFWKCRCNFSVSDIGPRTNRFRTQIFR